MDSLLSEPPGKPKNTGVGSLSPSPEELPNPGIKLGSPADSLPAELLLNLYFWTLNAKSGAATDKECSHLTQEGATDQTHLT